MTNRDRLELRAHDPIAQCLIRRLTVPRVYFEANWPGFAGRAVDLLLIDRDGLGDAHIVEIKRTAPAALKAIPQLLSAAAPFRWVAYLKGTEDSATGEALNDQSVLYPENTSGRIGVIEIVETTDGDLGANIRVTAERFPDRMHEVATAFSDSHKATIQF
jgi:hypothetical protein